MAHCYTLTRFKNTDNFRCIYAQLDILLRSAQRLSTDRGSQFFSREWKEVMKFLGIQYIHTTVYHAQANGLAERTIQTIKKSLKTLS